MPPAKTNPPSGPPPLPRQFWYFPVPDRPMTVRVYRRNEPVIEDATLLDISCCHPPTTSFGGVRVSTPAMMRYDERIALDLHCPDTNLGLRIEATVRTMRAIDTASTWLTGCVFAEPLVIDSLERCVEAGWLTRRSHVRHPMLLSALAIWEGGRQTPDIDLCDLGYGGFCVRSSAPPKIGSRVQLQVRERNCEAQLIGEVRWVAPANRGYLVGCVFSGTNLNQAVNRIMDFYKSIIADDEIDAPDGMPVSTDSDGNPRRRSLWNVARWWKRKSQPQLSA